MHTDLIEMFKSSKEIYGDVNWDLFPSADNLNIRNFENVLIKLVGISNHMIFKEYIMLIADHVTDEISVTVKPGGLGLTKEQCFKIHDYMRHKIVYDRFNKPYLHMFDSTIIYNYIKYGWELSDYKYSIKYIE